MGNEAAYCCAGILFLVIVAVFALFMRTNNRTRRVCKLSKSTSPPQSNQTTQSAEDIIKRYNLQPHRLIRGGYFREMVRTDKYTQIYYLQEHHHDTIPRVYTGRAKEAIVWIDGADMLIDDNGKIIALNQTNPVYISLHTGSNALNYNVERNVEGDSWSLVSVIFSPPFDSDKLKHA